MEQFNNSFDDRNIDSIIFFILSTVKMRNLNSFTELILRDKVENVII